MSEKPAKPKDVVSLDVETNLFTTEGRSYLNQLRTVSQILLLRDTAVEFKGEQVLKTGYVGEFKSVQLFRCPNGFFLFGDRIFGKNNWSVIGKDLDELLAQIPDQEVRKKVSDAATPVSDAA